MLAFDAPGTPIDTVGQLLETTIDSREIQFALKVIGSAALRVGLGRGPSGREGQLNWQRFQ